jgi:hypothetical protein
LKTILQQLRTEILEERKKWLWLVWIFFLNLFLFYQ